MFFIKIIQYSSFLKNSLFSDHTVIVTNSITAYRAQVHCVYIEIDCIYLRNVKNVTNSINRNFKNLFGTSYMIRWFHIRNKHGQQTSCMRLTQGRISILQSPGRRNRHVGINPINRLQCGNGQKMGPQPRIVQDSKSWRSACESKHFVFQRLFIPCYGQRCGVKQIFVA